MRGWRDILQRHRWAALALLAAALAIKAIVPAGYMIGSPDQVLTVSVCADASGLAMTRQIVVAHHDRAGDMASQHAKSDVCPFTALAMAGTAGADPLLLASALAFILALGFARLAVPEIARRARMRPPLRGPPVLV